MREVRYTTRFKRDYRRGKSGRQGKRLDALLLEVVNLLAAFRHRQLVQKLDQGELPRARSIWSNAIIALILALIGVAMAVYLVSVRGV